MLYLYGDPFNSNFDGSLYNKNKQNFKLHFN